MSKLQVGGEWNFIHYGWKNDETHLDDVGDGDVGECLHSWHLRILANT